MILRADASTSIGAGHVMRCLALAQAWRDEAGEVTLVTRQLSDEFAERYREEGIAIETVDSLAGSQADADRLLEIAGQRRAVAIVVDGYHFGSQYHAALHGYEGATLAVDDCGGQQRYETDFVLNQNLGAKNSLYAHRSEYTKLLLGPKYALLRRELRQAGRQRDSRRSFGSNILVTFGGSDEDNVTAKVIEGLQTLDLENLQARVLIGALNPHHQQIADRVQDDSRFDIRRDVRDMAAEYRWADLAVVAGGSSNWEMCYFGLPRIVLVLAENQTSVAQQLAEHEIAMNLGAAASTSPIQIAEAVLEFLDDKRRRQRASRLAANLVDGFGARRCVNRLMTASETGVEGK